VNVSKDRLDVCVRRSEPERHGGGDAFVVAHDEAGIDTLVSRLVEKRPVLVIVEATGGSRARCVVQGSELRPIPDAARNHL
jgi:transposase